MKKALVIGGNSGVGLSIVIKLFKENYEKIYIIDKNEINFSELNNEFVDLYKTKVSYYKFNLINSDYSIFDKITDIDTLVITAGFGRVALFENLEEKEIENLVRVNLESVIKIIKKYYYLINSEKDFYTSIMDSISGRIASPLFSVYGSAKAGLKSFIENINCELIAKNKKNRILEVSPGVINGTNFNGNGNYLNILSELSCKIYEKMINREVVYIPKYEEVYKEIIEKNSKNPYIFGVESYNYKIDNNRLTTKPQLVVGYLSGTFDLFHIGHLKLLKRAKEECDYLIVGVHSSGLRKGKETFIPLEERMEIVGSIKYVDKVIVCPEEDSDAWDIFKYNKLFVGSDYKGTERFNRYEKILNGKAEIIYFPYTKGTSSTQLREKILNK